jgi:endonuclease/exonuclease/phosphatase family metal-dependent hydrolase
MLLASRSCAPLVLLTMLILVTTGIVTLNFNSLLPSISFNRQRASEVAEKISESKSAEKLSQLASKAQEHLPERVRERPATAAAHLPQTAEVATGQPLSTVYRDGETIRIASFNIQVFGTSKASKPHVMDILARVVRNFDIVAIQELRTSDQAVMDDFVRLINANGARYDYVIGPRLGRTVSKEQYVFVFDTERIEVAPNSVVTLVDSHDLLHREPLIGHFRTRWQGDAPAFTFILINIHTDPDETDVELDALGEAFVAVQQNPWGEDDVVLLGDLNVDYTKFGALGRVPDLTCTVQGQPTNTRGTKSYDNIVFSRATTIEFTGNAGVLDLQREYSLSPEAALEVSDHLPVWAEFTVVEGGSRALVASRTEYPRPSSSAHGDMAPPATSAYPSRDAVLGQPRR